MKPWLLLSILTISFSKGFSQNKLNTDSLVIEICNTVKSEILETDSLTIMNGLQKHLNQYFAPTNEKSFQTLFENCYYRLQRECPEFKYLLDKVSNQKGDWKTVEIEPSSVTSNDECIAFFRISAFKYVEANGDTTKVIITDSSWTDHFLDGTLSRLSLAKTNYNDFTITFIESNNIIRKGFSKPGDKYRYKIIRKFETYYEMFVEILGSPLKMTFRLYF